MAPGESSRDLLLGPLFTLRNQGFAESVQIGKNQDKQRGPPEPPLSERASAEKDARKDDLVPTRAAKRTGSHSDHGIATATHAR
ncbi:hypothetical protein GCM10010358_14690 [Streptomyces minutiscleroticus]|uniref:Uncharacterized protein n=1 Tax=Streptomyces minutiscleroticus TaxID=68238 RepID=A0A918NEK4_9ACTN|nr:hypothetical protein GCM10010358_14690 [Streptomyces minutiscleroticus]